MSQSLEQVRQVIGASESVLPSELTGLSKPSLTPMEIVGAQMLAQSLMSDPTMHTMPDILRTLSDGSFWGKLSAQYEQRDIRPTLTPQRTQDKVGGREIVEKLESFRQAYDQEDPTARKILTSLGGDNILSEVRFGVAGVIIAADLFSLKIEDKDLDGVLDATQQRIHELSQIPVRFQNGENANPNDVLLAAVLRESFIPTKEYTPLLRDAKHALESMINRTVEPVTDFFALIFNVLYVLAANGSKEAQVAVTKLADMMKNFAPNQIGSHSTNEQVKAFADVIKSYTLEDYKDLLKAEQNPTIAEKQKQRWGMDVSEKKPSEAIKVMAKSLNIVPETTEEIVDGEKIQIPNRNFDVLCTCIKLALTKYEYNDGKQPMDNVWNKLARTPLDEWQSVLDSVSGDVSIIARTSYELLSPQHLENLLESSDSPQRRRM